MPNEPEGAAEQQRPKNDASPAAPAPLSPEEGNSCSVQSPSEHEQDSNQQQPPPIPPSKWRRPWDFFSKHEWVMVFLTAVIAATGIVGIILVVESGKDTARIRDAAEKQACAASKSAQAAQDFASTAALINGNVNDAVGKLDTQGKIARTAIEDEERPWLKLELAGDRVAGSSNPDLRQETLIVGGPLQIPMRLYNLGKTPAVKVTSFFFAEVTDKGTSPKIPKKGSRAVSVPHISGTIFPADHSDVSAIRFADAPVGRAWKISPITPAEANLLASKGAYVAVYGFTEYWDIFGCEHRTYMCRDFFISGENAGNMSCALRNGVEDEKEAKCPN